jgi:TonB family protein
MVKLLVITLVVLGSLPSFSQSVRQYLDEDKNLLTGPEGASYYREITLTGKLYAVKDFYASSEQLAVDATCSQIESRMIYDGPYKRYHKNGKLMEDGAYEDSKKRGLWKSYYENGQQEEEAVHEKDKSLYQQHWDESGNPHLVNGSGQYTETNSRGVQHTEILDYLLISSYSVKPLDGDTIYFVAQEIATYKGGLPALYQRIAKTMRYPANARRRGIQGKVFVEFVIEKDGKVRDVKIIQGAHEILNEEAVRVMKMMDDWTPGKVKGKPVAQMMILPIVFKLG